MMRLQITVFVPIGIRPLLMQNCLVPLYMEDRGSGVWFIDYDDSRFGGHFSILLGESHGQEIELGAVPNLIYGFSDTAVDSVGNVLKRKSVDRVLMGELLDIKDLCNVASFKMSVVTERELKHVVCLKKGEVAEVQMVPSSMKFVKYEWQKDGGGWHSTYEIEDPTCFEESFDYVGSVKPQQFIGDLRVAG